MAVSISIGIKENKDGQNVADNTSSVTVTVTAHWTQGSFNQNQKPGWVKIDGKQYDFTSSFNTGQSTNGSRVLYEVTVDNIAHDTDGKKTLYCSASYETGVSSRTVTANATKVLSTIPRGTTPKLSATSVIANGSNSITIEIKPADATFKHKIRYDFGSLKGYISGLRINGEGFTFADFIPGSADVVFTPFTELLNQIPSTDSGVCTILLYTYTSSGAHIGTKSVNLTLRVPTYTPSISKLELVGNNLLSDAYVEDRSTVTATITASSSYGATIESYSSTVDEKVYEGSKFTTSPLSEGEKSVSVVVTDTRGKTAKINSDGFMVYEYFSPNIRDFELERQEDDETVIVATVKGKIAAVNEKNYVDIFKVTLDEQEPTSCSYEKTLEEDGSYTINGAAVFTDTSTDITYNAVATLKDHYKSDTMEAVLPTVEVTMDFHESGKGIAIGKVSEDGDELLEIAWDVKIHGKIKDADDNDIFQDSGWRKPNFSSDFEHYVSTEQVAYRRVGAQVFIRGAAKPKKTLDTSALQTIFTLPEGFRPTQKENFLCQGSGGNKWLCTLDANGAVSVSRYGTTTADGQITTSTWLPMSVSFLVN